MKGACAPPFLLSIFFAEVIKAAYTIKADEDTMDALVHTREKRGRGEATTGKTALAASL